MKTRLLFILLPLLVQAGYVQGFARQTTSVRLYADYAARDPYVVMADTTRYGEDLDDEDEDTVPKTRKNIADLQGKINAMDNQLETRYRPTNHTFTKRLLDHAYVQAGIGMEKIVPPISTYKLNSFTTLHAAIGKDFGKYHSLRLQMHYGMGFQENKDLEFNKYGLHLDYIYGLSSYFAGYNPSRLMNLSVVIGGGYQMTKQQKTKETDSSLEGRFGFQAKFYTGPQCYVNVEPYVGIGGDGMDLSGERNWKKADIFYGVNANFVYYLRNNLSPEAKKGFYDDPTRIKVDTIMWQWQQPWFVQMSGGIALMDSPRLKTMETLGSELSVGIGKWLSPVIGVRLGLSSRATKWNKYVTPADQSAYHPQYMENLHNVFVSGRAEVMVNPMGFMRNFDWDSPFGGYLFGGYEIGRLLKTQEDQLSCMGNGYSVGLNLWYKLSSGLKVFIEPRFSHIAYKIPYDNVEWDKRFLDNNMMLNVGLALEMRDHLRFYQNSFEYEYSFDNLRTWFIGIGGGLNMLQTRRSYDDNDGLNYNGLLFGEYHLNRTSAVRLAAEFLHLQRSNINDFTDYNMDEVNAPEMFSPVQRTGLWNHKYNVGFLSLGYEVNLTQLFVGYRPERFRLYAFLGPTMSYMFQDNSVLSPLERIMENHRCELNDGSKDKIAFGGHIGAKLDYRLSRRLTLFFSPTIYLMTNKNMPGIHFLEDKAKTIQSFNLGVQYGIK